MRLDKKKLQGIAERAQRLGTLKEHSAWPLLLDIFEKKRERFFAQLARELMRGKLRDQRELDFERGYWAGAEWILANPEKAEATFEQAMRRAMVLREGSDS